MKPADPFDLTGLRLPDGSLRAFTSIGSYPLVYITADSGALCPKCASSDGQITDPYAKDFYLVGAEVYWEGEPLICDHCNEEIESAYGVP
jgi:hypothetical protein